MREVPDGRGEPSDAAGGDACGALPTMCSGETGGSPRGAPHPPHRRPRRRQCRRQGGGDKSSAAAADAASMSTACTADATVAWSTHKAFE